MEKVDGTGFWKKAYVRHFCSSFSNNNVRVYTKKHARPYPGFDRTLTSYGRKKRKKSGIKILYVIWMLVPDLIIWTHALTKRIRERLRSSFLCGSKWVQIIRSGTSIQTTFIFWKWLRFIKHLEFSNKWLKINESEFRSELDHRCQRQTAWNRSLTYHI